MANKRLASLVIIMVSLILVFGVTIYNNKEKDTKIANSYDEPLALIKQENDPLASLNEDFTLKSDFSSHLPIVIIDTKGINPPINSVFNQETLLFEPIKGLEPYVDGTIQVLDNGTKNQLNDSPTGQSKIKIKRRGNTSMNYAKPQYLVKLVTQTGQENDLSLLEMGADNEWVLNGSMTDKSMMRNYLSYRIASRILPYTPDTKYCEVVTKENGNFIYQGVYLLGESVQQGIDDVNISNYKVSEYYHSYIVRRDRYDEESIMLNTYATENKLSGGFLGLRYPSQYRATPQTIDYIEKDISKIERIIYSKNYSEFSTYPDYINVDSFVDYFLINEFFGNYDAGNNSTYLYKDVGGKLCIGPVWDFDGAIDNYTQEPMNISMMAFYTAPWFDRLVTDQSFVVKLEKRYAQLRRSYLSEKNILGEIEKIEAYIGSAQAREWARWNEIRKQQVQYALKAYVDDDFDMIFRETSEYQQEVYKLKTVLLKHGDVIPIRLKIMEGNTKWQTNWSSRSNLLILFVALLFCVPIIYIARH